MNYRITEKHREYLETKEGRRFFEKISNPNSRSDLHAKRKAFISVPKIVRNWLERYELITAEMEKDNKC